MYPYVLIILWRGP